MPQGPETLNKQTYWMAQDVLLPKARQNAFALPGFDEYLLGYKDRSAVLDSAHAEKVCPGGNGVFASAIVINGHVVGTWKRTIRKAGIEINALPFAEIGKAELGLFEKAAGRYAAFLGCPVVFA